MTADVAPKVYSDTPGVYIGYMYRRNFTFGLASPSSATDGAAWVPGTGPAESWTLQDGEFPPGTDGQDVNTIACAVNTFGQKEIYSAPYNGLCSNGAFTDSGFGMMIAMLFWLHSLRQVR